MYNKVRLEGMLGGYLPLSKAISMSEFTSVNEPQSYEEVLNWVIVNGIRLRDMDRMLVAAKLLQHISKDAFEKAIELSGHTKDCEHPYALVHTRCLGELNTCLKCGKTL